MVVKTYWFTGIIISFALCSVNTGHCSDENGQNTDAIETGVESSTEQGVDSATPVVPATEHTDATVGQANDQELKKQIASLADAVTELAKVCKGTMAVALDSVTQNASKAAELIGNTTDTLGKAGLGTLDFGGSKTVVNARDFGGRQSATLRQIVADITVQAALFGMTPQQYTNLRTSALCR